MSNREYPDHPFVGVGGVVIQQGKVLLVRRASPPLAGEWSIPGGILELGETLPQAARRELLEETGLQVEPGEVLEVFERIERQDGRVRYHYVVVDYLCRFLGGELAASSDVSDARWVLAEDLPQYRLTAKAAEVIRKAFQMHENRSPKAAQRP